MIGLFAVSEMMKLAIKGTPIVDRSVVKEVSTVWQGVTDAFRHWWLVARSSLLACGSACSPGSARAWRGWRPTPRRCRPRRRPSASARGGRGTIAPSATMGANEGGGLMPTLAFGIPAGRACDPAGGFVSLGVVPGPDMLTKHLDLVFSMVWNHRDRQPRDHRHRPGTVSSLARLPSLHANIMVPIVLGVCFVGALYPPPQPHRGRGGGRGVGVIG